MNMHIDFNQAQGNQLTQANYVQTLVEQYQADLVNIEHSIAALNTFSAQTVNLMKVCGTDLQCSSEELLKRFLRISYWKKVYLRSNISELQDAQTKSDWQEKLLINIENKNELPEFTSENVISTLESWYLDRDNMFADRVDSVFRALSRTHVTNSPEGFSKKMIFSSACEDPSDTTIDLKYKTRDSLHDLACCIATILQKPLPHCLTSYSTNNLALGTKHSFYCNFFEIQVFKNGSMHLWVHPSLAIELNLWLAKKYPSAIPTQFRTKTKALKEFTYTHAPLTVDDVKYIESVKEGRAFYRGKEFSDEVRERFAKYLGLSVSEVEELNKCQNRYAFEKLCSRLIRNGYPNIKDHQYYPTPVSIVDSLKDYLGKQVENTSLKVLEPSAGSGNLASVFNISTVDCIEVSPFFCDVLQAKQFKNIVNGDFLKHKTDKKYDYVVMNPPYADKRLESHLQHALTMLEDDGELLIVAPTGKHKIIGEIAKGRCVNMLSTHTNAFQDTTLTTSLFSIS